MESSCQSSFLNCGKTYKVLIPNQLSLNSVPLKIASVKVDVQNIKNPRVLINYSQNCNVVVNGYNILISVTFELVRKSIQTGEEERLEKWTFKVSEGIPTVVEELVTIEPLVLNYCDSLNNSFEDAFIYTIQIIDLKSNNASYTLDSQQISAIACSGSSN
ncbi:DUF4489 domain-containing protein [Bacillus carboniphilus]|uniref:DUF4489 domain-containing protein n=1 Tax=Bacillus carboniphilus TaxID=86663 RepID=A0ABY9JSR7_9BACI|nr:DUF4489 domain-containing protein [Bacillus carboniphilus]WLR42445.1 DUF4489 domain-containing protein [Bacillus carboniphilus]